MSTKLKGKLLFAQSGGPTAVINASAYGVIKTAFDYPEITEVYAAAHGILGVLHENLFDIGKEDKHELSYLMNTPSSEFGSCRYKVQSDTDFARVLEVFKKYNIRYFMYNGGNDSMDTCSKISKYFESENYECAVMGIPKTIDNDLCLTDHCPGFGSAAKYIATSVAEVSKDACVYDTGAITIIEIMGRHAGWLAGSSILAGYAGAAPDLIYLPEIPFDLDRSLQDVKDIYADKHQCLICVSEGIRYTNGVYVAEAKVSPTDGFAHPQLGGLAATLSGIVKMSTGAKVRGVELNLLQRCGAHLASQTDISEAYLAGSEAVRQAVAGETGKMVAFQREDKNGSYACSTTLVPVEQVANLEKKVPLTWINKNGNGVTDEFIDYALPLIQGENSRELENGLPRFAKLKKIRVVQ